MEEALYTLAALVLVMLVPVNIFTTILLRRLYKKSGVINRALRERYLVSAILTLASIVGGILGVNRLSIVTTGVPVIPTSPITIIMLVFIAVCVSVPGIMFLYNYFTDGFK